VRWCHLRARAYARVYTCIRTPACTLVYAPSTALIHTRCATRTWRAIAHGAMHVISIARGNKDRRFPAAAVLPNLAYLESRKREKILSALKNAESTPTMLSLLSNIVFFSFGFRLFSVSRLLLTLLCRCSKTRYRCCLELFCRPTFTPRLPFVLCSVTPVARLQAGSY
jgi:hypothetical protein